MKEKFIIDKATTVAFSGYRAKKMESLCNDKYNEAYLRQTVIDRLKKTISHLYSLGYRTYLVGMCDGFDLLAGRALLELKNEGLQINLIAVIPFEDHCYYVDDIDRDNYEEVERRAEYTITLYPKKIRGVYYRRNDFLLANSSILVTFFDGRRGGTEYTYYRAIGSHTIYNLCNTPNGQTRGDYNWEIIRTLK